MTTTGYAVGWVPVRREDGELIGFVTETAEGWQSLTVFGDPERYDERHTLTVPVGDSLRVA